MRIVVKVGTSTLAYGTGRLNIRHTEQLVKVLSDLKNEGLEVILVSSGAIGMGVGKLSLPQRPKDTASKQACAAVGQCELMYTYDRLFNAYNHTVAQILLTGVDVEHTDRRVNFQTTLNRLLELASKDEEIAGEILEDLAPFLDQVQLGELVGRVEAGSASLETVAELAPFLNKEKEFAPCSMVPCALRCAFSWQQFCCA